MIKLEIVYHLYGRRTTRRSIAILASKVAMSKTFHQMVNEALAEARMINPVEAHKKIQANLNALVIGARDATDIPITGIIPR